MSFPRYPTYKDSGVEWLGEVPGHWNVVRLKNLLARRITDGPHTTPVFSDDGVPFLSVDGIQDGELDFGRCRFVSQTDHEDYRRKALPQKDDLLMGKAASTGKIARVKVDFEFSIWSPLALIRLDQMVANPAFYKQSLKSPIAQAQIDNLCTANTQKNISMDDIPKLILTRPPLREQTQISTFLDRETAKIDALVAEQRRLMELLKEKRQAVISHAVTKGLNANAPLKTSATEWLGDVPAHWETTRLKYVTKLTIDCPHDTPVYSDDGAFLVIRTADLDEGRLDNSKMYRVSEFEYLNRIRRGPLARDDIVYGREGERWGHAALVTENNQFCLGQRMMQFRAADGTCPEYLMWALNSEATYLQGGLDTVGATAPHVNVSTIRNYHLAHPPISEQKQIGLFLKNQTVQFDTLTTEAQSAIDLLQERRTALISAAVTGQIDVRHLSGEIAA